MKLLADMGISMTTVRELRRWGYDAVHLREENLQRLQDDKILHKAKSESRVILTFDLDFGDLLVHGHHELPSVIIFRLHNQTPSNVTPKIRYLVEQKKAELEKGALILAEEGLYRLRRLPIIRVEE